MLIPDDFVVRTRSKSGLAMDDAILQRRFFISGTIFLMCLSCRRQAQLFRAALELQVNFFSITVTVRLVRATPPRLKYHDALWSRGLSVFDGILVQSKCPV